MWIKQVLFYGWPLIAIASAIIGGCLVFSRVPVDEGKPNRDIQIGLSLAGLAVLVIVVFLANLSQRWFWHP